MTLIQEPQSGCTLKTIWLIFESFINVKTNEFYGKWFKKIVIKYKNIYRVIEVESNPGHYNNGIIDFPPLSLGFFRCTPLSVKAN